MTRKRIAATMGVLSATVPKNMSKLWWMREPPDFPSREPTPSIAAFHFSLHSLLSGMKESSFVASKRVYFEALARQFCREPKKTHRASGVEPIAIAKEAKLESLKKKKKKNAIPVTSRITGEIMALFVQENLRMIVLEKKTLVTVAMIPIQVNTCPI